MSTFADPEAATRDALLAQYASRGDAPVEIATAFPTAAIAKGSRVIQLDFEGDSADDYPVTARATVRVVVHANQGDRGLVKSSANTARSLLASAVVDGVSAFFPAGLSAVTPDPDTGNLMCWFRCRVDLLASPLAS